MVGYVRKWTSIVMTRGFPNERLAQRTIAIRADFTPLRLRVTGVEAQPHTDHVPTSESHLIPQDKPQIQTSQAVAKVAKTID